jgi:hypothetical protein
MAGDEDPKTDELLTELVITLKEPIGAITALNMREPTADEVDRFMVKQAKTPNGLGAMYYFIAIVAGVPEEVVRKMKQSQVKEAMRFLVPFTDLADVFPKTGET